MTKNTQKGFIVPLVLLIVALLVIAAGAYVNKQDSAVVPPVATPVAVDNPPPTPGPVGSLKLYVARSSYVTTDDIVVTIIPNVNTATYKGTQNLSLSLVNNQGSVIHTINTTWPQAGSHAEATSSVTFSLLSLPNYQDLKSGEYSITGKVSGDVLQVIDVAFMLTASTVHKFVPIRSIGIYSLISLEVSEKGTSEVYRIGYGLKDSSEEQFSVQVEEATSIQSAKTSYQAHLDLPQSSYKSERVNIGTHVLNGYTHNASQSIFWKSGNYVIVVGGYKNNADMNTAVEEYLRRFPVK